MGLFKKKKVRFGKNIKPSCEYCAFKNLHGDNPLCTKNMHPINGCCKKYQYNPLLRIPAVTPKLDTKSLSEEDFSLD